MTNFSWYTHLKAVFKPWVPARVLSFYRQFRQPLLLPDRSEVVLIANADTLPEYEPRRILSQVDDDEKERQPVTLIATVYNEALHVGIWLDSLRNQTRLPNEIVITDGGSTDGTLEILRNYAETFPVSVQVISEPGANIARGRNLAIAAASHEIIACSDCGSLLDENWLNAITLPFDLDTQIVISAGYYDVLETNTLSRLARHFFGVNLAGVDPQKFLPSGRSLAFRRSLWANAGGYPEWLSDAGEDTLFDLRLKAQPARWAFVPAARVAWYAPDNLRKLLTTYFRYSCGDGETGIAAELYWYKVVEWLRLWLRRCLMLLVGFVMIYLWPPLGVGYFCFWFIGSLARLWFQNRPHSRAFGSWFFPYTVLLEMVGTIQAFAFALGVVNRPKVQAREAAFYRAGLEKILERYPQRRGVIVYPPTHDWGFMFQRPHQIARAFAHQGWVYFYCTENGRTDTVFGFREIEPGLCLTHVPPESFSILKNPVIYLGSAWNRVWIKNFHSPTIIYDHYDDLEVSGAENDDHFSLLQDADLVIVSAHRLLEGVKPYREDILLIPNGVDYNFIKANRPKDHIFLPADLFPVFALGKPIVGYSGALAEWFDYDLLIQAAQQYPAFSFVLVGVDYDGSLSRSGVLDLPNIFYLGMKDYDVLFNYVWRFDIAIIPFKINDVTLSTSPVKLFEYLACQKPVVVTDLPECRAYPEIFLAKNTAEFLIYLADALKKREDPSYLYLLDQLAKENTWKMRVELIMQQLSSVMK